MSRFGIQIASASDLEAIFSGLVPNQVRKVRSDELEAGEVASLNAHVVKNAMACFVECTRENLEVLAGIRKAGEGEQPTVTIGGNGYVFERNKQNRPLSKDRVIPVTKTGTYSNSIARGLWGTMAGVLVFTDEAQIASAQHTLTGALGALEAGDVQGLYFLCLFGLPSQFRDWSDKGRSRNKKQDSFIDESFFEEALIEALQLERTPEADQEKERIRLIDYHSKIVSNVLNRMGGKDISRTGDKVAWHEEKSFKLRFGDGCDVERLCVKLDEAGKSQGGKLDRHWLKLFDPKILGACLILASNDEASIASQIEAEVVRKPDESPEEYTERKLALRSSLVDISSSSPLSIDWSFVDQVLSLFEQSTDNAGPLATVFADLGAKAEKDKKSDIAKEYLYSKSSKAAMSACVELLKNIKLGDFTSSVWTSYRLVNGKIPPTYRNFGGIDVGFQPRAKKGKAE